MAIDWNREITLGGSGQSKGAIPTKTTMNLAPRDTLKFDIRKVVLAALALALAIGLFTKFAVIDVYSQVQSRQTELDQQQQILNGMQSRINDYDAVLDEYRSYAASSLGGMEGHDALEVMGLVSRIIEPAAAVTAASTNGKALTVNVKDIPLDRLGQLSDELKADPLVSDVSVSTANTTSDGNVTASIVVTLEGASDNEK